MGFIIGITILTTLCATLVQHAYAAIEDGAQRGDKVTIPILAKEAPIATSGDNMYIVWWSNKTGNDEVMFKASTDGGKTFTDKVNLSNSNNSDSQDAQIAAIDKCLHLDLVRRNSLSPLPLI